MLNGYQSQQRQAFFINFNFEKDLSANATVTGLVNKIWYAILTYG